MKAEDLQEDLDRVWDACFRLHGAILAHEIIGGDVPNDRLKKHYKNITDAIFLLGIKIQPWDFDERDLKFIEETRKRVEDDG